MGTGIAFWAYWLGYWLEVWVVVVQIPVGARDLSYLQSLQFGSEANPASYSVDAGVRHPRGKAIGAGNSTHTPVKGRG